MALITCKDCKTEISDVAKHCPACGRPLDPGKSTRMAVLVIIVAAIAGAMYLQHEAAEQSDREQAEFEQQIASLKGAGEHPLTTLHARVVADAMAQYEIAERQGDPMQRCVQAGFVSAAQLQAQDEPAYRRWKKIELDDCRRAGVPPAQS